MAKKGKKHTVNKGNIPQFSPHRSTNDHNISQGQGIADSDSEPILTDRMSNPTATCAQYVTSKHVFLADDKMANISVDVHTFIAQNLPKYRFHSSLD